MPAVFIPTMLQPLSGGVKQVEIEARNVRQIVDELERLYPGMKDRLVEDGRLRPNVSVAVDGEVARHGPPGEGRRRRRGPLHPRHRRGVIRGDDAPKSPIRKGGTSPRRSEDFPSRGGNPSGMVQQVPPLQGGTKGGNPVYPSYLLNTRQAFCPPKPKALDRTTRTSFLRAWLGT